ncbi:aminoglycoside 3-N-acetyltransferase [Fodinicurvata sp. EGI_FJ10296]|uniref:aminoglycoside 3-N-acetyltransferase n=1 Tax=Fodinicurvata sp. EGI_FJ10296 TaxID=3231908 RepID=UPI0034562C9E
MSENRMPPFTRASLALDLTRLGLQPGDTVMVHAAISRIGPVLGGPDAVIGAVLDAVDAGGNAGGTVMAYVDWGVDYDDLLEEDGRVPAQWRAHIPPFDPASGRAIRDNGIFAEFFRTTPGARRSGNPGASVAAIGSRADWLTRDHPLDYGYGEGSPFAKLVEAGGKVLMLGAPLDTMTLLHHAEHLAPLPGKRIRRYEVPLAGPEGTIWRMIEEFDTTHPVLTGLAEDYFATVVRDFLNTGAGVEGHVGHAPSVLVNADEVCHFAVAWLLRTAG